MYNRRITHSGSGQSRIHDGRRCRWLLCIASGRGGIGWQGVRLYRRRPDTGSATSCYSLRVRNRGSRAVVATDAEGASAGYIGVGMGGMPDRASGVTPSGQCNLNFDRKGPGELGAATPTALHRRRSRAGRRPRLTFNLLPRRSPCSETAGRLGHMVGTMPLDECITRFLIWLSFVRPLKNLMCHRLQQALHECICEALIPGCRGRRTCHRDMSPMRQGAVMKSLLRIRSRELLP
jgi:hypothetical protein